MCEYPGCSTTYGLDAHHVVAWALGGVTDLTNLVLLCRRHHVCVHEGGVSIVADRATAGGWRFRRPNGEPVLAPGEAGWFAVDAELELARLAWAAQARAEAAEIDARLAAVAADFDRRWDEGVTGALGGADALVESGVVGPIVEPGAGEGFHLTDCVDALLVGREREDRRG